MINQELIIDLFKKTGAMAANLFSQSLGRTVKVSAPSISIASKKELSAIVDSPSAIVCAPVESPRPGVLMHVFAPPLDTLLPELIVNPASVAVPQLFTELHKGALAELMANFWAAGVPVMEQYTGSGFRVGRPEVIHMPLRECLAKLPLFTGIESFVLGAYNVKAPDAGAGLMLIVIPSVFLKDFMMPRDAGRKPVKVEKIREIPLEHIHSGPEQEAEPQPRIKHVKKGPHDANRNLAALLDVPMEVIVELGKASMDVDDILAIGPGSVVELEQDTKSPISVFVNGKLIARGEAISVGENFGLRITQIVAPTDRLKVR